MEATTRKRTKVLNFEFSNVNLNKEMNVSQMKNLILCWTMLSFFFCIIKLHLTRQSLVRRQLKRVLMSDHLIWAQQSHSNTLWRHKKVVFRFKTSYSILIASLFTKMIPCSLLIKEMSRHMSLILLIYTTHWLKSQFQCHLIWYK